MGRNPDGAFPAPTAVAGDRAVAQGATPFTEGAKRVRLAGRARVHDAGNIRCWCAIVGVACRSETARGHGEPHDQQGAGYGAAPESDCCGARADFRGAGDLVGVC